LYGKQPLYFALLIKNHDALHFPGFHAIRAAALPGRVPLAAAKTLLSRDPRSPQNGFTQGLTGRRGEPRHRCAAGWVLVTPSRCPCAAGRCWRELWPHEELHKEHVHVLQPSLGCKVNSFFTHAVC